MKKVMAIGLFVNAVLLAGILLKKEVVVHAAGGGGVPVGNGDVNGDGMIDISDAVYTLTWLFLGGEAPVAIECPPPGGGALPATGQANCYGFVEGQGWSEVPCGEAACQGQDGQYGAGCPSAGRFVDNGDGTVTDTCTGLMWQKDTADVNGDGKIDLDGDTLAWCDALAYCESLDFAGHDDWRLPNVRELQSIVDYGRWGPAIDPVFEAESDWYWSSTSFAYDPAFAWYVIFFDGRVNGDGDKDIYDFYVRAVRAGS